MTGAVASASRQAQSNFPREMLARMAFIRAFEAKVMALSQTSPPQVPGSMHLCAGQEAVPLGTVAALRDDDQIIATYRGHGWALAAGLDAHAVMAEICLRASGLNGGRGGSAYMMAPHTRFIGENSIVGAGTTMACGVALANQTQKNGRVVVVSIGDGAMNQGSVHEAMSFAAVRQLPVIFVCENNGWCELTPTSDMFRIERLAQKASGYGIQGATVSGTDPEVVRDTIALAAERARSGQGPVFLEFQVPRLWGHYNKDVEHYRSKQDKASAVDRDPIVLLKKKLVTAGAMSGPDADALVAEQDRAINELADSVMASPAPDAATAHAHVVATAVARAAPNVTGTRDMTYLEAVNAALRAELESDERTLVYGEDVGKSGGIFGAARYLQRDFGAHRVFDTPIAENAILGSAVGAAISGSRPIVEIMFADFVFVAIDQLINQAANVRYVTGGQSSAPMVVRMQQGATPGSCAQHSQSIEAILAHVPGLKIAMPSTPQDAYSLLRAAAADPDPCVVIESRGLYQTKGTVEFTDRSENVGEAILRKPGKDAVIITWATMVAPSLVAARELEQDGIDVGVLDLRWIAPLDENALVAAVRSAGGRALIVHEAVRTGGFGAEIAVRLGELCQDVPSLRIHRHAAANTRIPASPILQAALLPNAGTIKSAVANLLR